MCETWRSAATPCLLWLRGHALARLPLRPALLLLCFEASVEGLRFRKIGFRRVSPARCLALAHRVRLPGRADQGQGLRHPVVTRRHAVEGYVAR